MVLYYLVYSSIAIPVTRLKSWQQELWYQNNGYKYRWPRACV